MADLADLKQLDWVETVLPEDFEPLDAIVLVKGVYQTDDGDLTRPVWCHRWTRALARNGPERLGALQATVELTLREIVNEYTDDDE